MYRIKIKNLHWRDFNGLRRTQTNVSTIQLPETKLFFRLIQTEYRFNIKRWDQKLHGDCTVLEYLTSPTHTYFTKMSFREKTIGFELN